VRIRFLIVLLALLTAHSLAQDASDKTPSDKAASEKAASNKTASDKASSQSREASNEESSSLDTRTDTSPPKDDAKNHPNSSIPSPETAPDDADTASDVHELHPWNPYRAVKDDEVGDFYFKRKNYKAALARYQDALAWKENDAVATFRMAQCYERLDQPDEAVTNYKQYLKILPEGPFSKEAKKALDKLAVPEKSEASKAQPKP